MKMKVEGSGVGGCREHAVRCEWEEIEMEKKRRGISISVVCRELISIHAGAGFWLVLFRKRFAGGRMGYQAVVLVSDRS